MEEKSNHINLLELKAAFYTLKCFASDLSDCYILLRLDNTTAISYINHFGPIQYLHLTLMTKQLWRWCEERNIFLFASYITSIDNTIADRESRSVRPDTEWSLSQTVFSALLGTFGSFDLDLFASIINAKCEAYISWFPDPGAVAIDAFTGRIKIFCLPSVYSNSTCLTQNSKRESKGCGNRALVAFSGFVSLFCRLLIEELLVFPPSQDLLSSPFRTHHLAWRSLSLVAGNLSGETFSSVRCCHMH